MGFWMTWDNALTSGSWKPSVAMGLSGAAINSGNGPASTQAHDGGGTNYLARLAQRLDGFVSLNAVAAPHRVTTHASPSMENDCA
jgi:hypothetical protein